MGSPFIGVGGLGDVYKSIGPNENRGPGEDNGSVEGNGQDEENDPRKMSNEALHGRGWPKDYKRMGQR
ncbi:UNVERIFIED_CONTAM: hypothetical protein Slati_0012500 [Sesamum latifolium]|uniref:Uncharacterized protein n=1 Tax=Sesamum latifolium TaxID=2727402 RepID=A0AAW2Y6C2_9LAMI